MTIVPKTTNRFQSADHRNCIKPTPCVCCVWGARSCDGVAEIYSPQNTQIHFYADRPYCFLARLVAHTDESRSINRYISYSTIRSGWMRFYRIGPQCADDIRNCQLITVIHKNSIQFLQMNVISFVVNIGPGRWI